MAKKTNIAQKISGNTLSATEFNELNNNYNEVVDEINTQREIIKLNFVDYIPGAYRFHVIRNKDGKQLGYNGVTYISAVSGNYISNLRQGMKVMRSSGLKKIILPTSMTGEKSYLIETAVLAPINGSSIELTRQNFATKNQYIHPSVAYSEIAINGYKYFCFISNYPREDANYEDDDLLCSVDGIEWTRVLPYGLAATGDPQLPSNVFLTGTDFGREKTFVPIPPAGSTFKLNGSDFTTARSLKHDPEIIIKDGYIYLYSFYNFYESNGSGGWDATKYHRFIVVFRSNNVRDWEICRTDGTIITANPANIAEIFTQSSLDGKNNFIRYYAHNNNPSVGDSNIQIVHDNVVNTWYAYAKDYGDYANSNIGIKRYTGTSLLNFNWSSAVYCQSDKLTMRQEHPDIEFLNGKFYYIASDFIHESVDGITFTELPYLPFPVLPESYGYKTDICIGENGHILVMTGGFPTSYNKPTMAVPYLVGNDVCTSIFKLSSFADILNFAKNGKNFASISASITVYPATGTAKVYNKTIKTDSIDWVGIELCEHDFKAGDEVVVTILSTAQGTGVAQFSDVIIT